MKISSKIFVAGHRGLVGSAIVRSLEAAGYSNLVLRTSLELDLTDQAAVRQFFSGEQPEYVFLAAAKVGGILANSTYPADFISKNLLIQSNVIESAFRAGLDRLLFLGSSCIYPKFAPQPIPEEAMLSGPLEPTNRAYAIAKISGIEMCSAYNKQYGTRYLSVMPTNLYGANDNYDPETSHVIPALLRRFHEAKMDGRAEVQIWGSGSPRREFLYSQDLADACLFLMNLEDKQFESLIDPESGAALLNIGSGEEVTIHELAEMIASVVGYRGPIGFDRSKPDGTPRKFLDSSRLYGLGWRPKTSFRKGLELTYQEFVSTMEKASSIVQQDPVAG